MNKRLGFSIVLVIGMLCGVVSVWGMNSERLEQARKELESARAILAEVTNASDRVLWETRVSLAEKELANVERLAQLEEKERRLASRRNLSADYSLRQVLGVIAMATNRPQREVAALSEEITRLQAERRMLEKQQQREGVGEDAARQRIFTEIQLKNNEAEILARSMQRDVAEVRLQLAREAVRIDQFRKGLEINPRPTLARIHSKRQGLDDVRRNLEELRMLHEETEEQRQATMEALDLARQRFEHIDDELAILQHRYRVEKENSGGGLFQSGTPEQEARLSQARDMLNIARSEKQLLNERLRFVEEQINALAEGRDLLAQGVALLASEEAFRINDLAQLRRRFFRRILTPAMIILLLVIVYLILSRKIYPRFLKQDSLFVARRLSYYGLLMLSLLVLIVFFLDDLKAIATVMGLVGAAIVIALQDLCSSFAGWFVIVTSRKIKVGDRVEIDGQRGEVIDIQILRTTLAEINNWLGTDEPTGRVVVIPNSFIFKGPFFNYSHVHPFIWGRVDVVVTYETPAKAAFELLMQILSEETTSEFAAAAQSGRLMEKRYGVARVTYEPRIHTEIADSGVRYSLYYVAHYRRFKVVHDRIASRIIQEFEQRKDMDFAYPTERHIPTPVDAR